MYRIAHLTRVLLSVLGVSFVLLPAISLAQGVLVDERPELRYRLPRPRIWPPRPDPRPEPPQAYKIEELAVHADLDDQVARVQVSQSFVNTGSRQMEVSFIFPLPYDGAVDGMTFMVDGKEYPAKLLTAREARQIYERHVRRNEDPALLEWLGTGMLKTSVFPVPPGARRTVTMRYSQICRSTQGLTEWLFPLSTAKYTASPVEKITFNATIQSQKPLKSIYSPSHSIEIKRPSERRAQVSLTLKNRVPSSDFRLMFDVGDDPVSAGVLSYRPEQDEEGYFLMLLNPDIQRPDEQNMPKTVVFVVDRSGSMSGKKIEQAKGALNFVLNNLNSNDLFNIVAYDNRVESFRPELQRYSEQTRTEALGFIEGIYAGGSTNIDGALQAAMGQLQDTERPTYIVFLTDGLPTAGERREAKIVQNARQANDVRARIFAFGVGYDVNSRLLDKLARTCFGQSQYVRPNEDIEAQVARLYRRIEAPALVNVKLKWELDDFPAEKGELVSRVYPRGEFDLFAGEQQVLVGRYKEAGKARVTVSGKVAGQQQTFHFPAELVPHSSDDSNAFVEKLWALRRVGEIIDQIDLEGKNEELVEELVTLATKHGILTPYTAFLADETANVRDLARNRRWAGRALDALQLESGEAAFGQRQLKSSLQRARQAPSSGYGSGGFGGSLDLRDGSGGGMSGPARNAASGSAAPAQQRGKQSAPGMGKVQPGMQPALGGYSARPEPNDAASGATAANVLRIGQKTFFWKNDRWEDSELTEAQLKNVRKIKRYSSEYFDLIDRFGKRIAKYLAIDETAIVVIDGKAYQF